MKQRLFLGALLILPLLFLASCAIKNDTTGQAFLRNGSNNTTAMHKECSGNHCIDIQGSGTDECYDNSQCLPPINYTHKVCSGSACIIIDGQGPDQCQSSLQCSNQTNQTHKVCTTNGNCVVVAEPGIDQCQNTYQCQNQNNQTNSTHKVCSGHTCISAQGSGADLCQSNAQCGGGGASPLYAKNSNVVQ